MLNYTSFPITRTDTRPPRGTQRKWQSAHQSTDVNGCDVNKLHGNPGIGDRFVPNQARSQRHRRHRSYINRQSPANWIDRSKVSRSPHQSRTVALVRHTPYARGNASRCGLIARLRKLCAYVDGMGLGCNDSVWFETAPEPPSSNTRRVRQGLCLGGVFFLFAVFFLTESALECEAEIVALNETGLPWRNRRRLSRRVRQNQPKTSAEQAVPCTLGSACCLESFSSLSVSVCWSLPFAPFGSRDGVRACCPACGKHPAKKTADRVLRSCHRELTIVYYRR